MKYTVFVLAITLLAAAAGCEEEELGPPTGAACPDTSTLTYDTFGSGFFGAYCTGCHGSDVTGDDRNGAPTDLNWDDFAIVMAHVDQIDRVAGAGPDATNEIMPPAEDADTFPELDERQQLAEWIACGAPQ
ncbi:MAG TPA: hypothetical protein VL172_10235 [Kofleriaceae bacterium]|nr:hypothetical protein [Kofleriaceae bacterium]